MEASDDEGGALNQEEASAAPMVAVDDPLSDEGGSESDDQDDGSGSEGGADGMDVDGCGAAAGDDEGDGGEYMRAACAARKPGQTWGLVAQALFLAGVEWPSLLALSGRPCSLPTLSHLPDRRRVPPLRSWLPQTHPTKTATTRPSRTTSPTPAGLSFRTS